MPPTHGTLTSFNASTGAFTYTPNTGYWGPDSFTFTATDGTNASTAATVSLSVIDNVTPVANAQSLSTNENTAVGGSLVATDADNNPLTYAIAVSPTHGTLTSFNASNGTFTYTPTAGYWGPDSFTFTATDGTNASTAATVSLSVIDNVTPVANAQSLSTNENTAITGSLVATDADNNLLTYAIAVSPTHGTLTSFTASTGAFTYTPTAGYWGPDSFTFTATDGTNASTAATVSLSVIDNVTPVANSQSVSTNENTAVSGSLVATDTDNNPLTYAIAVSPTHGTLTSFTASTGAFAYTPTAGYWGPDSFTFTATDGTNASTAATVSLSVIDNVTPVANGQSVSTNENTAITGSLVATDADNNPLTYAIAVSPTHGTLTSFNASTGAFSYTPTAGYWGPDSFTFTATDGTNTSTAATVSLSVIDNVAPVANAQSLSTNENTAASGSLVAADADNNPLTYAIAVPPTHGTLTSFNASTGAFTYTPTTGYWGPDSFTFTATDGTNTSTAATVSLSVIDNVTPVANAQSLSTNENTAASGSLVAADADNNPLTYAIAVPPTHGTLTSFNASNGNFTYTPTSGYWGPDSFTFTATDGTNTSTAATVSLLVIDNITPVADTQSLSTNENTATSGTLVVTDADNNPLTYAIAVAPTHGMLTSFNASNGNFTYTPTAGYWGPDSFTFTATDGTNASTAATVSLSVIDNVMPVANAQSLSTNENTAVSGSLVATDADNKPLTYAIAVSPTHGTLTSFNASNGAFTYTPTTNYHGPDNFTFTATDGVNTSSAATVTLTDVDTVTPVANAQSIVINGSPTGSGTLTATDANNDPLTFAIVGNPAHGTLSGFNAATGAFTYTPTVNYQGSDCFTFTASDGTNTSAAATVTITISGSHGRQFAEQWRDGDNYTLTHVGATLELLNGAMNVIDARPFSLVTSYTLNGQLGQHDTLTVDFSGTGGNPIPAGGVTFNGGSGGNDSLAVSGAPSFTSLAYNATGAGAGNLVLNPRPSISPD